MKTKFFRERGLSDEAKKGLKLLAALKPETQAIIIDWFKQLQHAPRLDRKEVRRLSTQSEEPADVLEAVIETTSNILQGLAGYEDSAQDFADDLRTSAVLDQNKHCENIRDFFEKLSPVKDRYNVLYRTLLTEGFGAPIITGANSSAAIKPVYSRNFKYGEDDPLTFCLKPINYACVALIELERSSQKESFCFQMNQDNFDRFLSDLLVLQSRMKQMANTIETLKQSVEQQ